MHSVKMRPVATHVTWSVCLRIDAILRIVHVGVKVGNETF